MPHMTLQYSSNLDGLIDLNGLCNAVHAAIFEAGHFELGAIRVRALRCETYAIADLVAENSFVDMVLRIGEGRSQDDKKAAGDKIFSAAASYLDSLFKTPHFALSFEIREIDAELSWKKNAIHPRLRGK